MFAVHAPVRRGSGCTRRTFLAAGVASLLAAKAGRATGQESKRTAVIQIFLCGGPSQHDTFDPKPNAPSEIRGPFRPIATRVPGVFVTELFPRLARRMDRISIVRSLNHREGTHHLAYHWMQTGYQLNVFQTQENERPAVGAVTSHLRGANRHGMPPYVTLPRPAAFGNGAYLGVGCNPFAVDDPNTPNFAVRNLQLTTGLTLEQLRDRRGLRQTFDQMSRDLDSRGVAASMDQFDRAAFELLNGNAAKDAFDLSKEDARLRDAYGRTRLGQSCLMARRLVEAGVTYITIEDFEVMEWDLHGVPPPTTVENGTRIKADHLDRALSALISDLSERGMLDHVLVAAYGEFGRTPRINGNGGRDHWGLVYPALFAGGGLTHGQTIGSSDANGERPKERPFRPDHVLATLYHLLGIDLRRTLTDASGRPREILEGTEPIRELF